MDISIPKNPKVTLIPKAVITIKKHSIDLNKIITKDILSKSNVDQFLFLIGIASYEGKNFNLNFSHIKFYIQNVIKDDKEQLLKIEAVLHEIFLKKYETEEAYNKFYYFISTLYKIRKNKEKKEFKKIKYLLFYVPSPVLLAHTNPLFYMLENRRDTLIDIVIASRGRNQEFENRCQETNVNYVNIERKTYSDTIKNLASISKSFEAIIWQSTPVHLGYFRTLNQNIFLWSHKFHPNIPGLLGYIGSFNDHKDKTYINKNFWKNLDVGFEIRNKNKPLPEWKNRKLNFGSFCREELINDKLFWRTIKIILEKNNGSKFYYCGRKQIHKYWCDKYNINKSNITFLGWLEQPHLKLREMSFLIDGFSLGHGYMALEAMAASIPIIFPKNRKSYGTLENYIKKTTSYFNPENEEKYKQKYLLSFENENELIHLSKKLFYDEQYNNFYGLHYTRIISKLRNDNFEKFISIINKEK